MEWFSKDRIGVPKGIGSLGTMIDNAVALENGEGDAPDVEVDARGERALGNLAQQQLVCWFQHLAGSLYLK